jgi:mannosyl-oligosaccharide alpha-1,2-mannosidase
VAPTPEREHEALPEEWGQGRLEGLVLPSSVPPIHWKPQSEHYPVPAESTIHLPAGSPSPIPKIQAQHTSQESESAKKDREQKLSAIKEAFKHAWTGYAEHAWLKDELSPVTGKYRNPFCGWAATLIDSLDTLWIMGMEDEFHKAVAAVKKVDFTTSLRADIPLFETTIRYLGGLLSAYDVSGAKHRVLLSKAVELAEILMGAFDTPNRMPVTFYQWKP